MTNTEIIRTQKALLTSLQAQSKFLLQMASQPLTCPACHVACSEIDAADASRGDLEKYDTFKCHTYTYHCTSCGRELIHDVYLTGGHGWRLTPAEAALLRPAVEARS